MPELIVRPTYMDVARRAGLPTVRQIAQAVGVHPSNLARVVGGSQRPSSRFIAGSIVALGAPFEELFDVAD